MIDDIPDKNLSIASREQSAPDLVNSLPALLQDLRESLPSSTQSSAWQAAYAALERRIGECITALESAPTSIPAGFALVPLEPEPERLVAMAKRTDNAHDLRQSIFTDDRVRLENAAETAERQAGQLAQMRRLYEEATGQGAYRPVFLPEVIAALSEEELEDVRVLNAALAAGPTPGPRERRGAVHDSEVDIRPKFRGRDATPRQFYEGFRPIATVKHDKRLSAQEAEANALLIEACSTDRLTRLLARLTALAVTQRRVTR